MRPSSAIAVAPPSALNHAFVCCLHLALLLLLYFQTFSFDYVYFDDADYVIENPGVMGGLTIDGIRWAFTSFYMSNWHPLTWLSHMLDVSLFGPAPGWAHLHNAGLHLINSLLVYALLLKLSGSWIKACILSLVFLAHPLHVESVAWIAERKDLLCALFFLLGLLRYDSYRAQKSAINYLSVLLCFVLALLAKPMAVTFPVVLVLLDIFVYRENIQKNSTGYTAFIFRALVEKIPFILLSGISSVVTILAQNAGDAVASLKNHTITARLETVSSAYITYIKQFLAPVKLVIFYPVSTSFSLGNLFITTAILLSVVLLPFTVRKRLPLVTLGFCIFLVTLLPVIGLVQVGSQAHADRYMYIPSVGLLIACVYLLPERHEKHFQFTTLLAALFVLFLTLLCFWQVSYWRNEHTLFSRAQEVSGPNYLSHLHLAQFYTRHSKFDDASQHSLQAMTLDSERPEAYQALGNIALAQQNFPLAEKFYTESLEKASAEAWMVNNLGIIWAERGEIERGIAAFEKALEMDPSLHAAQQNIERYRTKRPKLIPQ